MNRLKTLLPAFSAACLFSACTGNPPAGKASADTAGSAQTQPFIDTAKVRSDLNVILNSISSGKPDTAALKAAGADVLTTTANVLSDSGISRLYGDSKDPAVATAKNLLIKMRDSMGITPAALDSMRKAAGRLAPGH